MRRQNYFYVYTEQNQLGLQEDMAGQEIAIVTCIMTEKDEFGEYETPAMFIAEYAPKFNDGPFCASKDGTNIFFTRNSTNKKDQSLDGSQKLKIMQATIIK
jgi:hypothetical protein